MSGYPVFVFLPILTFLLGYIYLVGGESGLRGGLRRSFLLATCAWGAYLTLGTELLSLFGAITAEWVVLGWLLPLLGLGVAVRRSRADRAAWKRLAAALRSTTRWERSLAAGIAMVCGTLFLIAIISPPNTYDSALYHMARVVHWSQNLSLEPYPAP